MDQRLLDLYKIELHHLRQSTGEFARTHPKIAGRLDLDKDSTEECPDQFVERLLEGFAYLAARVQRKIDAEFPRFTQSLLETVYPQYLAPTPSMAIVQFEPNLPETPTEGMVIPRDTPLRSVTSRTELTPCEYRTAHEVTLWPLRISEAVYYTRNVGQLNLPNELNAKAAIRLRLEVKAGLPFEKIKLSRLPLHLRGEGDIAERLYEQIFAQGISVLTSPIGINNSHNWKNLGKDSWRRGGMTEEEALLPHSPRGFEGYRLLREYFALPQRFLFCDLLGLDQAIASFKGSALDVVIALREQDPKLDDNVGVDNFKLYCSPAINLFPRSADRILLSERFAEFEVTVDRMRPLDFEIFEVQQVIGYGSRRAEEQEFRPFYKARDAETETGAFFTTHRVPRMISQDEERFGKRSDYTGSEVYLSLVDTNAAPYRTDLKTLGIRALCTNRHLPIQMQTEFEPDLGGICQSIRCLGTPSAPIPSAAEGETAWRIISHLSLNYLSLLDADGQQGARALRELLGLYVNPQKKAAVRQIEGLLSVKSTADVERVPTPGPVAFARGLQIEVLLDESMFEGTSVFLMGSVLEQFFARYVSINSFTRTVILTKQHGKIMQWPARMGRRQII